MSPTILSVIVRESAERLVKDLESHNEECPVCGHGKDERHETFCSLNELKNVLAGRLPGDDVE